MKFKRGGSMTKITAGVTGVILVVLGVIVAFIPFGNPLSEYLVTKNAESYIGIAHQAHHRKRQRKRMIPCLKL